ncbi:MAG: hypothetical protein IGR76_00990 [Synechococcales cyanobacterium T60_A2020_003]|nr:hypothetical protein [Synechococcales cyanobacterium T60_A2020_003]
MSDRVSETSGWAESFQQKFDALTPLILNKYQQLDADTLAYTEGNLDLVVDYIAAQTDHTRTLVQHHLGELYSGLKKTLKRWMYPKNLKKLNPSTPPVLEKML